MLELLGMLLTDLRVVALFALLAVAAISDCRTLRIPNWLTMGGALFGLAYSIAVPFSPQEGFLWALGGLAVGLLMLLPMYAVRAMGAGDVKLMAMAGSFLGVSDAFFAVISTFIAGGIAALAFALYHRATGRMLNNIRDGVQLMTASAMAGVRPGMHIDSTNSVGRLPYGASIAAGTITYVVLKHLGFL